jgi:hypothetical protein
MKKEVLECHQNLLRVIDSQNVRGRHSPFSHFIRNIVQEDRYRFYYLHRVTVDQGEDFLFFLGNYLSSIMVLFIIKENSLSLNIYHNCASDRRFSPSEINQPKLISIIIVEVS